MDPSTEQGKNYGRVSGFRQIVWVDSHPLAGRRVVSAGIVIFTMHCRAPTSGRAYSVTLTVCHGLDTMAKPDEEAIRSKTPH
jgi:hypothetical protein